MKSLKHGKNILVSVENITPFGIWLYIKEKEPDLLVFAINGGMARIEVKSKQGKEWPNCIGIIRNDSFIIFVDLERKHHGW